MNGSIIAAFPATGKTFYAERHEDVIDSDSSSFSRGEEWPGNYIGHIAALVEGGVTVLTSTHAEVRRALREAGMHFTLVYPEPGCREEYRRRMVERGSLPHLIAKVVDDLWYRALYECRAQDDCTHVVLKPGEYLTDALRVGT